ncbi:Binding-protein-dependent transport systems inner membrane component [Candidatus Promineifilum breve]|uniref:Binding-protein-dependent transport systems inner membrane component n=1 Tax=Candidatus Promineifilum breve TaxID=1806508 RepID=A0A160T9A9_9CHLR|nr:sugar ABC transporter permease [Candidatus Promineifilum breve]CUS05855.1 Binding-protein-dependent transport systems inner membrane component [Candidatus Promineifilum breve]
MNHDRRLRLLLLPYAVGLVLLFILPALLSFGLAFFRYDALSPPRFAGLLNFQLARTDELFGLSIANSLALVVLPAPLRVTGAFLAARLARGGRLRHLLRAAVFLPSAVPASAFALAWLWILNPLYGPLNRLLAAVALDTPGWLADGQWARPGIALALLWLVGEGFLVCLAALYDVPQELEDAAAVDGAGTWATLRHVLLPLLAPVLLLLLARDAVLLLQDTFSLTWLLTGGGPYYATYTLPQFIYEAAFDRLDFGVASAALWVLYVLTGLILAFVYVVARQWQVGLSEEEFLL